MVLGGVTQVAGRFQADDKAPDAVTLGALSSSALVPRANTRERRLFVQHEVVVGATARGTQKLGGRPIPPLYCAQATVASALRLVLLSYSLFVTERATQR